MASCSLPAPLDTASSAPACAPVCASCPAPGAPAAPACASCPAPGAASPVPARAAGAPSLKLVAPPSGAAAPFAAAPPSFAAASPALAALPVLPAPLTPLGMAALSPPPDNASIATLSCASMRMRRAASFVLARFKAAFSSSRVSSAFFAFWYRASSFSFSRRSSSGVSFLPLRAFCEMMESRVESVTFAAAPVFFGKFWRTSCAICFLLSEREIASPVLMRQFASFFSCHVAA